MNNPVIPVITVDPQQGQNISIVGDTYRILIGGKQTNGAFATIDMLIPPGGGPGPHAHPDCQESFYVVEGEIMVKTKAQTYTAKKGAFVTIPIGGVVHSFKNESDTTAHIVCLVVPAGLDQFFEEIGQPVEADHFLPPPPMDTAMQQRLMTLAEKYNQQLFPPDYLD